MFPNGPETFIVLLVCRPATRILLTRDSLPVEHYSMGIWQKDGSEMAETGRRWSIIQPEMRTLLVSLSEHPLERLDRLVGATEVQVQRAFLL